MYYIYCQQEKEMGSGKANEFRVISAYEGERLTHSLTLKIGVFLKRERVGVMYEILKDEISSLSLLQMGALYSLPRRWKRVICYRRGENLKIGVRRSSDGNGKNKAGETSFEKKRLYLNRLFLIYRTQSIIGFTTTFFPPKENTSEMYSIHVPSPPISNFDLLPTLNDVWSGFLPKKLDQF